MTQELQDHNYPDGEISFIGYGGEDHTIITCGWDRTIKVHMDELVEHKSADQMVKRGKAEAHKKDILCGDYSHNLGLIATGGRDNRVRIWEYEKVALQAELMHNHDISIVHFIKPFPLLLTSDSDGTVYIWLTKPHPLHRKCVLSLKNQGIDKVVPVTAIDSFYKEHPDGTPAQLLLLQGDENGEIVVYDILCVLTLVEGIEKVDITDVAKNPKRNPHREFPIEKEEKKRSVTRDGNDSDNELADSRENKIEALVNESQIKTVIKKKRVHNDAIRSIQYINVTDQPLILTASFDRLVHLIDFNAQVTGTLKQGYKTMLNYHWEFPIAEHLEQHPERLTRMERMLKEVREQRNKDLSHKKLAEIKLLQSGKLSTFGFAGSQLMGMTSQSQPEPSAYNTAPRYGTGSGPMSDSRYNSGAYQTGSGGYQTQTSQYSSAFPRKDNVRRLIDQGKRFL